MVLAVSVSALNAGIGSSIGIGLKCGIGTFLVKIQLNNTEKVFSVLYRYPNSKLSDFQSSFKKAIENLNKQKLIYYLCGDFNIDLLQSDTKTVIKNYSDMLFSLGCLPLIKYPTRIAHSSATLIDHFYSNSITQKTTSHILTENISDHMPIVLLLSNTNHKIIEQNSRYKKL